MLCGCGKMGQAMLHGWLDHADSIGISKVTIIDPNLDKLTGLPDHPLVTYFNNDDAVPPTTKGASDCPCLQTAGYGGGNCGYDSTGHG
jgi:hypothetical protein